MEKSEIATLQPAAIVDHVCCVDGATLRGIVGDGNLGGSRQCDMDEFKHMLSKATEFTTRAGGSAANVARALASGFGTSVDLVGARGTDEWGALFVTSLRRARVSTDKIRTLTGPTGRSLILTDASSGQRTMRTHTSPQTCMKPDMLVDGDFAGMQWVFLSAYSFYVPGLMQRAVELAKQAGARIALDLASYEVVTRYFVELEQLLQEGAISCCICNEDEAVALLSRSSTPPEDSSPEAALRYLSQYCEHVVVTLGSKGCIALQREEGQVVHQPAVSGISALDTTGAGDNFTGGFLYGLMRGMPLRSCARIGCLAGAAAVRTMGAELGPADWQWFHQHLHSTTAAAVVENSAEEVYKELLDAYALVERIGVGVVYFGSARLGPSSKYWQPSVSLACEVAKLLQCPTWTGGGPGMMRAASEGAMAAGMPVGGVRISREAGQDNVLVADYLQPGCSVVCRHLPSRKAALIDAGVRQQEQQRTAFIFLPGGLGTMDELFALMTLIQLQKLNTRFPVPLLIVNYHGFYDGLMGLLKAYDDSGVLRKAELEACVVAATNEEVLDYLAEYYGLERPKECPRTSRPRRASDLMSESDLVGLPPKAPTSTPRVPVVHASPTSSMDVV